MFGKMDDLANLHQQFDAIFMCMCFQIKAWFLISVDFNIGDFVLKSPIANIYSMPTFYLIRYLYLLYICIIQNEDDSYSENSEINADSENDSSEDEDVFIGLQESINFIKCFGIDIIIIIDFDHEFLQSITVQEGDFSPFSSCMEAFMFLLMHSPRPIVGLYKFCYCVKLLC